MIVALIGLAISFFAYFVAFPEPHHRRFDVYLAVFALHLATTITYWLLSFESAMDAFTYYRDPWGFNNIPFELGSTAVIQFVQLVKATLGGSFLDHFLLFQCFGMLGIAFMLRTLNEACDSLGIHIPLIAYAVAFFPGIHFWSVAIGKDGPLIMAIGLSIWASMRIERRWMWMTLALTLMVLIRPHIAAIAIVALVGALLFTRQLDLKYKLTLGPVAAGATVFLGFAAMNKLGMDSLNLAELSDFIEDQQQLGEEYGSGAELQNLSFPLKVFSLLFRPLYVDAPGMLGLVASIENTILLYVFGYILVHWRTLLTLVRNISYVAYCTFFALILIPLLSLVNYNIGLGQRQKMMAVPAILLLYATIALYRRYQRLAGEAQLVAAAESAAAARTGAAASDTASYPAPAGA